ncbi:hypothetical protein LEMLEM_LOCUS21294, partial [Lemmus lemmus]
STHFDRKSKGVWPDKERQRRILLLLAWWMVSALQENEGIELRNLKTIG